MRSGQSLKPGSANRVPKRFILLKPLCIYWLSIFLICFFPLFFFSLYAGWSGYFSIHEAVFVFLLSSVLIYARFIEPHLVHVHRHRFSLNPEKPFQKPVKVALVADLHIGLFSGHERQLKIIVNKINQENPDIVVVAGDWTYEPENQLAKELEMLREIKAPVYSVTGNHDEQYPGPPIQELLRHALESNNVIDIEGKIVLSELFPTSVRYTGSALTFNLAGIFGASFAPLIATKLAENYGLAAVGYYLSAASILSLIAFMLIRETKNEDVNNQI